MKKSFQTPGPLALDIRLAAGSIDLETAETGETDVEVEPMDSAARELIDDVRVELRDAREGQELRIEVPERRGFFGRNPSFAVRVQCPHSTTVETRTRSADVDARGRFGSFASKGASGDVEVEHVEGVTAIHTASGDIALELGAGPIVVNTASGDVTIGRSAGQITANLVSGDLTVREADGQIEAHTVSGDQRLDAVGAGTVAAASVSGDIVVGVRRGSGVWMDVRSISGDTESELDASDGPPADESKLVELRLNTVSGDIRIRRSSAAPATAE